MCASQSSLTFHSCCSNVALHTVDMAAAILTKFRESALSMKHTHEWCRLRGPAFKILPYALPVALNKTECRWDEHFELLVHHPEHQSVTAVMYDSNMIGRDEEIGRVSVPIEDLPPGETQDLWLDLEPPATRNGVRNPLDAGLQACIPSLTAWESCHRCRQLGSSCCNRQHCMVRQEERGLHVQMYIHAGREYISCRISQGMHVAVLSRMQSARWHIHMRPLNILCAWLLTTPLLQQYAQDCCPYCSFAAHALIDRPQDSIAVKSARHSRL